MGGPIPWLGVSSVQWRPTHLYWPYVINHLPTFRCSSRLSFATISTSTGVPATNNECKLMYKSTEKFALTTGAYVLARLAQQFDTCETVSTKGPIEAKLGAVLIPAAGVPVQLFNSLE